jgi:glycosyltransferase involved in cell wall biosynthesis
MKIFLVIDYIWDYRLPLYQKLNQFANIEFLLTNWKETNTPTGLNCRVITSKIGLILTLLREKWDIIIWGDAGSRNFTLNLIDGILSLLISKIKRRPFILWFGGWEFIEKDHWGSGVINTIKRKGATFFLPWLLNKADAIVTYGNFHKYIYTSILSINSNKIFIAPNSSIISEENVKSKEQVDLIRKRLKLIGKKVVLYLGRLEKRKNVDMIIKAFAKLYRNDVCLLIVGDGELRSKLKKLCKQLRLKNVYLLGRIKGNQRWLYYTLCDVFVYPTSREPWGLAINEAMQFGKPVIATPRVAAAYDLIRQGVNGFIVPENDIQALAEAINKIISNEELAKRMGQKSKEIISKGYTYEHMAEGFKKAIKYCYYKKKGGT